MKPLEVDIAQKVSGMAALATPIMLAVVAYRGFEGGLVGVVAAVSVAISMCTMMGALGYAIGRGSMGYALASAKREAEDLKTSRGLDAITIDALKHLRKEAETEAKQAESTIEELKRRLERLDETDNGKAHRLFTHWRSMYKENADLDESSMSTRELMGRQYERHLLGELGRRAGLQESDL